MNQEDIHKNIWAQSSTRSFYNSPQHAEFMDENGETIKLVELNGSNGPVYAPVSRAKVWTWWRNTKVPVPPAFGPRTSIYMGLLATHPDGIGSPKDLLASLPTVNSNGNRAIRFIQPVLIEQGIFSNLEDFSEAIGERGIAHSNTETRIVNLPSHLGDNGKLQTEVNATSVIESLEYMDLLETFISKRRYDIRRAPRVGVSLDVKVVTSAEDAKATYESIMSLHRESWTRTGLGPHTLDYWTKFSDSIRESGGHDLVVRAMHDGEIISVVVVHIRGKSAFYQMNSSSLLGQKLSANPYALHAGMTASALLGAEYFELGRYSDTDSEKTRNINDYKSQFGGFILPVPNFDLHIR